jgi:hypothetical protein
MSKHETDIILTINTNTITWHEYNTVKWIQLKCCNLLRKGCDIFKYLLQKKRYQL